MKRILFSVVLLGLCAARPAQAELLRITPLDIASNAYVGPTDPVPIGSDGFRLTYHGGGNDELLDPILIILGVEGALAAPALTLGTDSGFSNATLTLGGASAWGGNWDANGFAGTFDSSSTGSVYDKIGLTPAGSSSQNYSTWSANGGGATSWNLFVYQLFLTPEMMTTNSPTDWVQFTSNLAVGTYVIGYGHDAVSRNNPGAAESTPFTFAGNVRQVPEPGVLSLLLAGAGVFALRRRQKRQQ